MALNNLEVFALDVGEKRIGVARVNLIARIPEPIAIASNDSDAFTVLGELIGQHSPHKVIIGLPTNSSGEDTLQTKSIRAWAAEFITYLQETMVESPAIELVDENFSSIEARKLVPAGKKSAQHVDDLAACVILEYYLGDK